MMDRRAFMRVAALACWGAPVPAIAQDAGKTPLVGWLWSGRSAGNPSEVAGFRRGLLELGYVEGENIRVEYRFGEGDQERLAPLAARLIGLRIGIIMTIGSPATRAAQRATTTVPIVSSTGDPVSQGFVVSLARPGGNITGLTMGTVDGMAGKWVELLKDALPQVSRIAYLWNPTVSPRDGGLARAQRDAETLGMTVYSFAVHDADEFDRAFAEMARARVDGLIVDPSHPMIAFQPRIAELALEHRLFSISEQRDFAAAGGLISYGASIFDNARRMAQYMDKVLKGARPADLPVQQPIKFELVINLKTAKALGITIPESLLARADEVIE